MEHYQDVYDLGLHEAAFRSVLFLETAMILKRNLFHEIFSIRIQRPVIKLRPCLVWDWSYNFPCLSPEWSPLRDIKTRLRMSLHQRHPNCNDWVFEYPSLTTLFSSYIGFNPGYWAFRLVCLPLFYFRYNWIDNLAVNNTWRVLVTSIS